eukprot:8940726-Pyramimonas_sp.AAC.1
MVSTYFLKTLRQRFRTDPWGVRRSVLLRRLLRRYRSRAPRGPEFDGSRLWRCLARRRGSGSPASEFAVPEALGGPPKKFAETPKSTKRSKNPKRLIPFVSSWKHITLELAVHCRTT